MQIDLSDQTRRRRAGAILVILGLALFILQYVENAGESVIFWIAVSSGIQPRLRTMVPNRSGNVPWRRGCGLPLT